MWEKIPTALAIIPSATGMEWWADWNWKPGCLFSSAIFQYYPDLKSNQVKVKITVQNTSEGEVPVKISLLGNAAGNESDKIGGMMFDQIIKQGTNEIEVTCPMGDHPKLWDEFEPNLYRLKVEMSDGDGYKQNREVTFGMREFKTNGTQFTINGRPAISQGNP